jgi:peroxiredoxin
MVRVALSVALSAALFMSAGVQAGGAKFGIGSPAPDFKNLPGVDGKKHSLADYKKDILVIAITCNHCPVAVAYEDRLIEFTKKYGKKIDIVAINVNTNEQDKLDKMIVRAQEKGFNFAYLYDESQQVAKAVKAQVTPEFYVFDKNRKLVYWGPLDDSQNPDNAKAPYLANAIDALLKGEVPTVQQKKAFGCKVQYN